MRRVVDIAALSLLFVFSTQAAAQSFPTLELTAGQWALISLPADPGSSGSIETLFSDDLPLDLYGSNRMWVMYAYDARAGQYVEVSVNEPLKANTGYWIAQVVAELAVLDVPDSLAPLTGTATTGCPDGQVCTSVPIFSQTDSLSWNLVGISSMDTRRFGESRFVASDAPCTSGCSPNEASAAGVVSNILFRFNTSSDAQAFEQVTEETNLRPWDGYWLAALPDAQSVNWVMPVGMESGGTVTTTEEVIVAADAERDAARLLMQGSFGPSDAAIDEVLTLGGPAAWIDRQLTIPASLHLPRVKAEYPEEKDFQRGRYKAFWDLAIRAPDQLRQRMAYSLSHIFVISDRSKPLDIYGNMTAAYYDVLVKGALGNYRDLLEAITLNPAMGVYLSMQGNPKADEEKGTRADENFAREMMQLFSIGLVGLNNDGTERAGSSTYTQTDVENLARILTGWSWDSGKWSTDSLGGWRPDWSSMERPMVAYPEQHDTGAKTFLGVEFAAGQSAEVDMQMALDRVFNHPNVGPFVGKQLIQRLVTSNPSRPYIARVANVFNDNGNGVRGDLAAVARAILLDPEARSERVIENPRFGKLRESVLRYSHLFRAFEVKNSFNLRFYVSTELPQIAPMTAPSVFNFFRPSYAPQGQLSDANLVAPEFQINTETNVNKVNRALTRISLQGLFHSIDSRVGLNLQKEKRLLPNAAALVDHLDLLLTAKTIPDVSRQVLIDYINTNRGRIDDGRLLKDVIALVAMSTQFAVQH